VKIVNRMMRKMRFKNTTQYQVLQDLNSGGGSSVTSGKLS
jgi:hypothetical protein